MFSKKQNVQFFIKKKIFFRIFGVMSHPGWVMVSFLTELLSSYGGFGKLPLSHAAHMPPHMRNCANDTEVKEIINLKKKYTFKIN